MRWGVRRYQNRDGTLTSAGKKQYSKQKKKLDAEEKIVKNRLRTKAKFDKLEERRKTLKEQQDELDSKVKKTATNKTSSSSESTKKVSEMSDDELREIVNRLTLEKRYSELNPKQGSTGEKIMNTILKDVVIPSATQVGKQALTSLMNDAVQKAIKETKENK